MAFIHELEHHELLELLFKADTTIHAFVDRDEAREELEKSKEKLAEAQKQITLVEGQRDRVLQVLDSKQFPTYHQLLEKFCAEFGVPGSPTFDEALAHVKDRLRAAEAEEDPRDLDDEEFIRRTCEVAERPIRKKRKK